VSIGFDGAFVGRGFNKLDEWLFLFCNVWWPFWRWFLEEIGRIGRVARESEGVFGLTKKTKIPV
jgi:hypothetical protein